MKKVCFSLRIRFIIAVFLSLFITFLFNGFQLAEADILKCILFTAVAFTVISATAWYAKGSRANATSATRPNS